MSLLLNIAEKTSQLTTLTVWIANIGYQVLSIAYFSTKGAILIDEGKHRPRKQDITCDL